MSNLERSSDWQVEAKTFNITGGVRQGGVRQGYGLSAPFRCRVTVWRKWRLKVGDLRFDLSDGMPHLIDLRFADDILLLACSAMEVGKLLDSLVAELSDVGPVGSAESSRVESSLHTKNGEPHWAQAWKINEMWTNFKIYTKFSLHSKPAEADEVVQMRFSPAPVFSSSIHPISKIFVSTINNQFLIPTVCRTSGIAKPRRSPSQHMSNPSVWKGARHIPCQLPVMNADKLRSRFDTGRCSEMFYPFVPKM